MKKGYPPHYTMSGQVATFDADQHRHLKPSSILKYQQEVGELHLASGGMSYSHLYDDGIVFVLSKSNCVIHRPLHLGEHFHVTTWHRNNKGPLFYRCYLFEDESGRPVIESVTSFAMIEPKTRRILRPKILMEHYEITPQEHRLVTTPDPTKLKLPESLAFAGNRHVFYSDTDYNSHLNNTVYADLLCDFMPGGMDGRRVFSFSISFLSEAKAGEDLAVHTAADDSGIFFYQAKTAQDICFEASCTTKEAFPKG